MYGVPGFDDDFRPDSHIGSLSLGHSAIDFVKDFEQAVAKFPTRIMFLKLPDIADPPDVVADSVLLLVLPSQFSAAHLFAQLNCL